jgi:hypothetical protein
MPTLMVLELSTGAETGRTDVYAISRLAGGVCTTHSDGMREIGSATIAFDLDSWFSNRYGYTLSIKQHLIL